MIAHGRWAKVGLLTIAACLVAIQCQRYVAQYSCCDMTTYIDQAADFARHGLFGSKHEMMSLRTYGYPYFVSLLSNATSGSPASIEIAVFIAQLVLLIAAAWAIASIASGLLKCSRIGLYGVIVLNPIMLAATPAVLTDLVSALAAALAVLLVFHKARHPTIAVASVFLASSAAMVRPASVVFVPITLLLWAVSGRWMRSVPLRAWPALIVAAVVPFVPQIINNHRLYGRNTPLIVQDLYSQQTVWGMQYLKYGTLMPPQGNFYANPWYDGSSATFFGWLHTHPLRALGTAGMHLFALFDQDFAFTYVNDVHPFYRWPLCASSFAYVFIGVATVGVILVRCWRRRRLGRSGFFTLALFGAASAYVLLYLPTAVETRFAMPVYLLLAPFVVAGVVGFYRRVRRDRRALLGWPIALLVFVAGCLCLSHWLAQQAPALVGR